MTAINEGRTIDISFMSLWRIVLVVFLIYVFYQVLDILGIILLSIVLSTALDPWVDWMNRYRVPRSLGVVIIYIALLSIISLGVLLLVPALVTQLTQLAGSFPYYYNKIASGLAALQTNSHDEVAAALQQALQSLGSTLASGTNSVLSSVAGLFGGLAQFIIALVITFYLIVDEQGLRRFIYSVTPQAKQAYAADLINRIRVKVSAWLRGQLLLMLIIGLMTYFGFWILNFIGLSSSVMQYALVLAFWAGLTEIVPYLGPILGGIPAVFIALAVSPIQALMVLVLYIIVQQLENNIIVPTIMKRSVGLNPIVSILVIMVGFNLGGVMGAIISIPLATIGALIFSDVFDKRAAAKKVEAEGQV
ncbi:AI-2E family transporter [Patescibacteria group bacterium]|nr:AI-2E family transporter [Patescibacteria group bacterium]